MTDVGANVGIGLGSGLGAVGNDDGGGVGGPGVIVGLALGNGLGKIDGRAVVGLRVGTEEGENVVADVGKAVIAFVGAGVGEKVTKVTPAPAIAARPAHDVVPVQPSRII